MVPGSVAVLGLKLAATLALSLAERCLICHIPLNEDVMKRIEERTESLRSEMAQRSYSRDRQKLRQLHLDFLLYLLDYASDWDTLLSLLFGQEFGLAVIQGGIILVPYFMDCYRGKVQLVDVVREFRKSRQKGLPSNGLILALQSEKGAEAQRRPDPESPSAP